MQPVKKDNGVRPGVQILTIESRDLGQRIDNYLFRKLKGVPKSRVYRALRSGEVRVGGARVKASYRLQQGDAVRIPPIRQAQPRDMPSIPSHVVNNIPVLFEDEHLVIVDKPSGLAVHGGTGMEYGLIEALRIVRENTPFLELVHRLDRGTSGCLMLAKSRESLLGLQQQLGKDRAIEKFYIALVEGNWRPANTSIDLPLARKSEPGKDKKMVVDATGQRALSRFSIEKEFKAATLVRIQLCTGRMHQARVHCASSGHPIAGDPLYGNRGFNRELKKQGLKRLFLHASELRLKHPVSGVGLDIRAVLPPRLQAIVDSIE